MVLHVIWNGAFVDANSLEYIVVRKRLNATHLLVATALESFW
jgi:hypothetical protein